MKLLTMTSASVLAFVMASPAAVAQERWTAELRGGANVNTNQFASTDLKTGFNTGATIGVRVLPDLFAYGGWDGQYHHSKAPLLGEASRVFDTGYAFGLRYVVPLAYRARPWLRGGGLYNHVEIRESFDGPAVADSKHTLGVEGAGGLEVALNNAWSVTPGLRYRRFEPKVRVDGGEASTTLSDVSFEMGVVFKF